MPGTLKVNYWLSLLIFFKFNYNPTGKYIFKVINKLTREAYYNYILKIMSRKRLRKTSL